MTATSLLPTPAPSTLDARIEAVRGVLAEIGESVRHLNSDALDMAPPLVREWAAFGNDAGDIDTCICCLLAAEGDAEALAAVEGWRVEE